MRILMIEDDTETADYLRKGLSESGHVADHAATGPDGLTMALSDSYDALIVDRMLPGLDGLTLIKSLREQKVSTPGPYSQRSGSGQRPRARAQGRR